jgi:hypothetical protein
MLPISSHFRQKKVWSNISGVIPSSPGANSLKIICASNVRSSCRPGMVPAHDEVRAAEVPAHQGVEDRLARARIPHGGRVYREHHAVRREVALQQHLVAAHSYVRRDVVRLRLAHKRVQQQTVDDL